jgi:hypothetical protein
LFGRIDNAGGNRGIDEKQYDRECAALDQADGKEERGCYERQEPYNKNFLDRASKDSFRCIQNLIREYDGNETLQNEDLRAIAVHAHVGSK